MVILGCAIDASGGPSQTPPPPPPPTTLRKERHAVRKQLIAIA
jgi:hypothetical protein